MIDDVEILNSGLSFALEFGPDLGRPINSRINGLYPNISNSDVEAISKECERVRNLGPKVLFEMLEILESNKIRIATKKLKLDWEAKIKMNRPGFLGGSLV